MIWCLTHSVLEYLLCLDDDVGSLEIRLEVFLFIFITINRFLLIFFLVQEDNLSFYNVGHKNQNQYLVISEVR